MSTALIIAIVVALWAIGGAVCYKKILKGWMEAGDYSKFDCAWFTCVWPLCLALYFIHWLRARKG